MKKTLSRNPNMLRTMIGLGMTLILLLGYAVYSNTLDSEYYRFETTNEEIVLTTAELDGDGKWYDIRYFLVEYLYGGAFRGVRNDRIFKFYPILHE